MKFVQPCVDQAAFEWIRNGRDEFFASDSANWEGNFVSHLFPGAFDAHAKLLHGIEANYENRDHLFSESERAILKIPLCEKLRSLVETQKQERRGSRIRWQTLAGLYDVPFAPEICREWFRGVREPACWPRYLLGPNEGHLNNQELSALLAILRPLTGPQECFFRFAEIPFINTNKPVLFNGVLEDLPAFLTNGEYQLTPEYWWPGDRSWCVCSDYDLTFTIVAGSKELVSRVLNDDILEALPVGLQTRIDSFAPVPQRS